MSDMAMSNTGWLPAATLTLTDQDLDEVAEAIRRTGAGSGPADPRQKGLL